MILLISLCLFVSFLNLIFTIFLSNSFFRFATSIKSLMPKPKQSEQIQASNSGLVDLKPSLTYDLRFRNEQ
jgi:hypothetical protein